MSVVQQALLGVLQDAGRPRPPAMAGEVLRYDGLIVESAGFPASPGMRCRLATREGEVGGEVVGFRDGRTMILLEKGGAPVTAGDLVHLSPHDPVIAVGPGLLGRVTGADGEPLDGRPAPDLPHRWPLLGKMRDPLESAPVDLPLDTGVRVINAALSVGRGQRLGILAGSGVGKSVLTGMMARHTAADVVVVGLIGERAREVGDFVRAVMSHGMADRVVIVAVPADRAPLLRLRAAHRATAIAEYFRDRGRHVLLIMDSLTRVAHARREIGLALGEQPTARGYPPSVVSLIPALIERSGPGDRGSGSVTAFYTVLADGDDMADPVVDAARAILDGHLVLSRRIAQRGIYPAVDLTQSVSRVMDALVDPRQAGAAMELRRLIGAYEGARDLIAMGAHVPGSDPVLDRAIALWPRITAFLSQRPEEPADFEASCRALLDLTGAAP